MALQDEQQIRTASFDNHSLLTANIHSDRLPRSSLQPTALDAAALQEKDPIERQEEFKMQVLKEPKCGPTWSGLEEQGGQVGSPGGAQSSSTPTVSSRQCFPSFPMCHQHKALGSTCFSHLRRQRVSTTYYGSLISIYLCLQMPILNAEVLKVQGPCNPVMSILDGKTNLSCNLTSPQHVFLWNLQKKCSKFPDSQVVYLCEDGRDRPDKAMTEFAGLPIKAGPEMCNETRTLKFLNDSWHSNCMFKNGSSSYVEYKVKENGSISAPLIIVSVVIILLILLISIGFYKKRNKLKNWWKNRSRSQPRPCHRTSQAIQPSYVPAPNADPADDDLHSVATVDNTDTAAATVDIHDAIPGETSTNPTEDSYLSVTTTMDPFLTADSESVNAYDSEARDSAYCDSYDSISLDAEACGSAVTALLAAEVKNELLSKRESQKQVEMEVFA